MKKVQLITDGSCLVNPGGPGGWACILRFGENSKELSGSCASTTNQRMEIQAAIEGLRALNQPCTVEVVTDSLYVFRGINVHIYNWRLNGFERGKKGLPNRDLWIALSDAMETHLVTAVHIRGHQDNPDNNRCDLLAGRAARAMQASLQNQGHTDDSRNDEVPAGRREDLEMPVVPAQHSPEQDRPGA